MASQNSKKPRKTKTSYRIDSKTGEKIKNTRHGGAQRARQSDLNKVLLGKGAFQSIKLSDSKRARRIIEGQHTKKSAKKKATQKAG